MKNILMVIIMTLLAASTQGTKRQKPDADLPRYEVVTTKDKISLDGKLSEKAWAKAKAITLMFPWENQTGIKHQIRL